MFDTRHFRPWAARLMRKAQMDRAGLVFGMRSAGTAWVALSVASLFHLPNAYWAGMAAFIVMQPTRGILLERGFYRLVGTLAGAAAGFTILHFIHVPFAALVLLCLWMAGCAALTQLFRHVRSYGAMLAGITAVVVVMPTLDAGDETFDLAMARLICTLVGVGIAWLGAILFVPPSPQPAFLARMRRLAGEAVEFAIHQLGQPDPETGRRKARALIQEMASLEQAMVVNTAGKVDGKRRIRRFDAFVGAALEVMAATQALVSQRPCVRQTPPASLPGALSSLAEYLQQEEAATSGRAVLDRILDEVGPFDARLANALEDLIATEAGILSTQSGTFRERFRTASVPYDKDWRSARVAGTIAGATVFAAGCIALVTGWKYGPLAALGVGNFVMILSSMENPHRMAPRIFMGVLSGTVAATIFRIWVLPHAGGTLDIVLMVFPFLLIGGFLRASRATSVEAVDYNMCFLLGGQPFLPAETDLSRILESGLALVLGVALVCAGFTFFRRNPGKRVRMLAGLILRDIERIADLAMEPGSHWRPLVANRLLRLTVHLGRIDNLRANEAEDILAALNMAHAIVDLRELQSRHDLQPAERLAVEAAIGSLRTLSSGRDSFVNALNLGIGALTQTNALQPGSTVATSLLNIKVALQQGATILLHGARKV